MHAERTRIRTVSMLMLALSGLGFVDTLLQQGPDDTFGRSGLGSLVLEAARAGSVSRLL